MTSDPSLAVPGALAAAWAAVLGACVGSFLNVVIARVPAGLSIVRPGSRCPRCETPIRWYDNLPVLSWLLLRARCRSCGAPISVRYPAVELLGMVAALAAWGRHGFTPEALAEFAFVSLLLALSAIDLDTWTLPHVLTAPLIATGLLSSLAGWSAAPTLELSWAPAWLPAQAVSSLLGAAVGAGAFWGVRWVGGRLAGQEALGLGDVYLLAGLGAWLGLAGLLPVILLSSTQGALVGLALMALGKAQTGQRPPAAASSGEDDWVPPRNSVPFGPFLALAAVEWLYLAPWLARAVPALEVFRG